METKKYTIHYNFYATTDVEVLAESEDDAIKKARQVNVNPGDYDFELNEECVYDVEEIGNLEHIIEQAENIIKTAAEDDIDFALNPWPFVTIEFWNGLENEYRRELMEDLYWDYEWNEIGFHTSDNAGDLLLSELPDIEQLEVCRCIIGQAEANGVLTH